MGDNSDKKKIQVTYFFMTHPYMKFQTLASMILNLCYEGESITNQLNLFLSEIDLFFLDVIAL